MNTPFCLLALPLFLIVGLFGAEPKTDQEWSYIQIDDSRKKWGDWEQPEWLRYFGLDAKDTNDDGFLDIVSGRYLYLNPGSDMTTDWKRVDLGMNTDGAFLLNVDDDSFMDVISVSLPKVFWLEAKDTLCNSFHVEEIAQIKETGHVNGQGYERADIVPGGKKEILIGAGDGIYLIQIPSSPESEEWITINLVPEASDEGFSVADLDQDGDLDIVASAYLEAGSGHTPQKLFWWENQSTTNFKGEIHPILQSKHDIDRIETADFNSDGKMDIVYSEERYPGEDPDAELVLLLADHEGWEKTVLATRFSLNNLSVGDVDEDGDVDIVSSEHKGSVYETFLLMNDGHAQFSSITIDTGKEMHLGAKLIDLDNDGDLDLIGHAWDHYRFLHLWRHDS